MAATPSIAQEASQLPQDIVVPTVPQTTVPLVVASEPATTTTQPIVIPNVAATSEPMVEPIAEPEPVAETAPAATSTSRSTTTRRVGPVAPADPSPISADNIIAETSAADVPLIDDGEGAEASAALPTSDVATPAPITTGNEGSKANADLVMAGGAAALGFGFIGLLMAGSARRRRRNRAGTVAAAQTEPVGRLFEPKDRAVKSATVASVPASENVRETAPVRTAAIPEGGLSWSSKWNDQGYVNASPTLAAAPAAALPKDAEGRRRLIDRLTYAQPDETIPFHSPKARRRRARLIVQTLRQKMREQPNLDFGRFYRSFGRRNAYA
ncbi:hypothetical protein [Croceicoccus naphthovorans]|uniref:hypothetical protein n=1 Tax=Croceicoccus naphthovorans TaxID=1348774 RepID=UPI00147050D8|nr:hypothetical protein [Croceicoccus naphthovorans]MBB3991254.1 hypothetical protein [Croceicoccus naphthovorans]